jgi:hypothetical protein
MLLVPDFEKKNTGKGLYWQVFIPKQRLVLFLSKFLASGVSNCKIQFLPKEESEKCLKHFLKMYK